MPITAPPEGASAELKAALSGAALAIWTTTPWTIPGNCAVALNGRVELFPPILRLRALRRLSAACDGGDRLALLDR